MTEVRPAADPPPPTDDARRVALMFATLGFAALPRVPAHMAPAFKALHQRLDGWKGIGDIEAGMRRQGYDLYLVRYGGESWRCTFFETGREAFVHVHHWLGLGKNAMACRPAGSSAGARQDGTRSMIALANGRGGGGVVGVGSAVVTA